MSTTPRLPGAPWAPLPRCHAAAWGAPIAWQERWAPAGARARFPRCPPAALAHACCCCRLPPWPSRRSSTACRALHERQQGRAAGCAALLPAAAAGGPPRRPGKPSPAAGGVWGGVLAAMRVQRRGMERESAAMGTARVPKLACWPPSLALAPAYCSCPYCGVCAAGSPDLQRAPGAAPITPAREHLQDQRPGESPPASPSRTAVEAGGQAPAAAAPAGAGGR